MSRRKSVQITVSVISVLCALIFFVAASGKFSTDGNMSDNFLRWGYSFRILLLTGLFEAAGGILLLIPKSRIMGAVALLAVMLGAMITHLRNFGELGIPLLPLVLSILLVVIIFLDRSLHHTT